VLIGGKPQFGNLGGPGGNPFSTASVVTRVIVTIDLESEWGYGVRSIQPFFGYSAGPVFGGRGGDPPQQSFSFDLVSGEFIIGAAITYDEHLQSIQFITNQRISPVYGHGKVGTKATLTIPPGTAVSGFFGRANWAVDNIGLEFTYNISKPSSPYQE